MNDLREGQTWLYRSRSEDKSSYLIIRKIDGGTIHVTVKNVHVNDETWDIDHVPIAYNCLMKDLLKQTEIIDNENASTEEFNEAYEIWKNENGGTWNVQLNEVIELTLDSMNSKI